MNIIALRKIAEYDCRSFDPAVAWDKQPFYRIDPHLIIINPTYDRAANDYWSLVLLHPGGKDIFDILLLERISIGLWVIIGLEVPIHENGAFWMVSLFMGELFSGFGLWIAPNLGGLLIY